MSTSSANSSKRLASLDAVRGFDMLFIAGLTPLLAAVCKLFPNGTDSWIYQQMLHADWNGFTHYDTIFPLFIFIAGISFPFSYAKMQEKALPRHQFDGPDTENRLVGIAEAGTGIDLRNRLVERRAFRAP